MQPGIRSGSKVRDYLYLFLFTCLGSLALQAQLANPGDSDQVSEVLVAFEGPQTISDEAVLAHVQIKSGMDYSPSLVDQSIRSLYDTGLYEFVQVRREPSTGGGLRLTFVVLPKYRISDIVYEGNDDVDDDKLSEITELEVGLSLDEVTVKRAADAVRDYYRENGFSNAVIKYEIVHDDNTGTGKVIFKISEGGGKIGIGEILFVGNTSLDADDLLDQMETEERGMISFITGSGRFNEIVFEDDLEKLRDYYRNHGFLDVEIPLEKVEFSYPSSDSMTITVFVEEGRQYRLGNLTISGNTLFTTEELMAELSIGPGDWFSPLAVDQNAERLKNYFGRVGYLDTYVRSERRPNVETGNIDLNYAIRESEKFIVESINIQGNTKTKSIVILRELALTPGEVFDLVKMKNSQARLRNTGFFEEVNLAPESTNVPGRRNLRVTVKEGRTGNLTFGAGFSSVESAVVFAEVTQGNFDLFNYRSMFQGDGQKFRLRLSLGSKSNQVVLAFEEPWMFERELAAGFEIFRTETDFNSSIYDELRTGFELYARKRLFELVEGRLSYRLESVDIFDIDQDASSAIKAEEGETMVSKVGLSLLRDTRDNLITPTDGERYQFITEYAGGPFGGDVDYVRVEGRAAKWWPISSWNNQVFSLVGRTGTVIPESNGRVPFFDRYFLGGPNTLRGFDFREVGPKDSQGEPIGGNTFGYFSAEYSIDLIDPVRGAVFYDGGFVNADDTDWSLDNYNDDVGVGVRVIILGAPLRVDFGFPLQSDELNDEGMQFNFSFGTVF